MKKLKGYMITFEGDKRIVGYIFPTKKEAKQWAKHSLILDSTYKEFRIVKPKIVKVEIKVSK